MIEKIPLWKGNLNINKIYLLEEGEEEEEELSYYLKLTLLYYPIK